MKQINIHISNRENEVLEDLARTKELSRSAVMRQALRLYQLVDYRLARGERMFFEGDERMELLPLIAPGEGR